MTDKKRSISKAELPGTLFLKRGGGNLLVKVADCKDFITNKVVQTIGAVAIYEAITSPRSGLYATV
jgi:hypothetical protein